MSNILSSRALDIERNLLSVLVPFANECSLSCPFNPFPDWWLLLAGPSPLSTLAGILIGLCLLATPPPLISGFYGHLYRS